MTSQQILTLIAAIVIYIVVILALTYIFGANEPFWLTFLALPLDLVGFIILFPYIIYRRYKIDQEYDKCIEEKKKP